MAIPVTLSPDETALVQDARRIARAAHEGLLDKAGLPYFEAHVADVHRRVVSYGGDVNEQIAALLHDVLEDTEVSEDELRNAGVPEEALVIVKLLTKNDTQPKSDYYERIRLHEPARRVKLFGDIASNTDPERLSLLPIAATSRCPPCQDDSRAIRHEHDWSNRAALGSFLFGEPSACEDPQFGGRGQPWITGCRSTYGMMVLTPRISQGCRRSRPSLAPACTYWGRT